MSTTTLPNPMAPMAPASVPTQGECCGTGSGGGGGQTPWESDIDANNKNLSNVLGISGSDFFENFSLTAMPYGTIWLGVGDSNTLFGVSSSGVTSSLPIFVNADVWASGYHVNGVQGYSGSFTTNDGRTVTVSGGIITSVV